MRTRTHVVVVSVFVAILVALGAAPGFAHTNLVSTSPGDGETRGQVPQTVRVTFSKPVTADANSLKVVNADGECIDAGDAATLPDRPHRGHRPHRRARHHRRSRLDGYPQRRIAATASTRRTHYRDASMRPQPQ